MSNKSTCSACGATLIEADVWLTLSRYDEEASVLMDYYESNEGLAFVCPACLEVPDLCVLEGDTVQLLVTERDRVRAAILCLCEEMVLDRENEDYTNLSCSNIRKRLLALINSGDKTA